MVLLGYKEISHLGFSLFTTLMLRGLGTEYSIVSHLLPLCKSEFFRRQILYYKEILLY